MQSATILSMVTGPATGASRLSRRRTRRLSASSCERNVTICPALGYFRSDGRNGPAPDLPSHRLDRLARRAGVASRRPRQPEARRATPEAALFWHSYTESAMPIYEYRCERGHTFEVMQRMTDDPLELCEEHGTPVQRVFHPVAVHFKGSGFYNTDYGKKKAGRAASEGKAEGSGGDSRRRTRPKKDESSKPAPARELRTSSPFSSFRTASRFEPVGDEQVAAVAAGGLEHLGVARVAGRHVGEQHHQLEAVHVGLERARRVPAHPGQPEERARRLRLRADRRAAPAAGGRRGRGRPRRARSCSCARASSRARAGRRGGARPS